MDLLIISTNRYTLPVPVIPLGACLVAEAARRAGHNVRLLDLMFESHPLNAVERALARTNPDVVGVSVRNIDNNDMQNPILFVEELVPLIETIQRQTKAAIVLGGSAVGVMPEHLLRYTGVGCAVLGDGESVFPEILRHFDNSGRLERIPGIAYAEGSTIRKNPCASLPLEFVAPDFSRWIPLKRYLSSLATVPVQSRMGCPFKCIYCTYRKIEGADYRLADQESVTEGIKELVGAGFRDIEFVDSVFNSPYDYAITLCERLARARLPVRLQSLELNPRFVDDALITEMERAGFCAIGITAENASDTVLDKLQKGFTTKDLYKTAEVVRRHKLPCIWIFLLGGPGETPVTIRETLRFARKSIRSHDVVFFNFGIRIYPGTGIESMAREEGVLSLAPQEMLTPVFYWSPQVDFLWALNEVKTSLNTSMNYIDVESIGWNRLLRIHQLGYRLGVKPPLWRHTRFIRKGLRILGMNK
ncbi:MAG: cobalamin-dependent protein [Pseudomonadota bacterium]